MYKIQKKLNNGDERWHDLIDIAKSIGKVRGRAHVRPHKKILTFNTLEEATQRMNSLESAQSEYNQSTYRVIEIEEKENEISE